MAGEAILSPDVEDIVCTWLAAEMAAAGYTLPVGTRVPSPRPAEFLRVLAMGGSSRNLVQDEPTLEVEAWATRESRASLLARTARALLGAMEGETVAGSMVYRSRGFTSPANLPDPTTAQVRYRFFGPILLRGNPL